MTTPTNGYVPADLLAPLHGNGSALAELNTAAAVNALCAAHPGSYVNGPAGGYWSRALDIDIHVNPAKYGVTDKNLSPIGESPHGLGIRVNIDNTTPAIAAQFGFTEFNAYTYTYKGPYSWDQLPPSERQLVSEGGWLHSSPDAKVTSRIRLLAPNNVIEISGYSEGEYVGSNNFWFAVNGGWAWCGDTTNPSIEGVPYTPYVAPAAPPVATDPAPVTQAAPPTPVSPSPPPASLKPVDSNPTTPKASTPVTLTPAQMTDNAAKLAADSAELAAVSNGTPVLAGLLAGKVALRKRVYVVYAAVALAISCGSDVVTYGLLNAHETGVVVTVIGLSTSVLLKIGAAFGLVAASNTK